MAHILIADDVTLARDAAARALRDRGHRVTTAADGQEAIDRFGRDRADLAILDMMMPRVSGLDACSRIKQAPGPFVPVIFISALSDLDTRLSALALGEDFLGKPYDLHELCARVEVHLRLRRAVEEGRVRGGEEARRAVIEPAAAPAPALAAPPPPPQPPPTIITTGGATVGLLDRAALLERLSDEWKRSTRTTDPMSLLLVGVDGPGTEHATNALASAMQRCLRSIDVLCLTDDRHIGGLLLNTHVTGVMAAVTRLRSELRRMVVDGVTPSVTMGAAFHPSRDVGEAADLLRLAERAVARAREEGGGHTCFWQHAGYLFDPPELA